MPGGKKNRGTCVLASRMVLWLVLSRMVRLQLFQRRL